MEVLLGWIVFIVLMIVLLVIAWQFVRLTWRFIGWVVGRVVERFKPEPPPRATPPPEPRRRPPVPRPGRHIRIVGSGTPQTAQLPEPPRRTATIITRPNDDQLTLSKGITMCYACRRELGNEPRTACTNDPPHFIHTECVKIMKACPTCGLAWAR
jgi:hypothetical protein